MGKELLTDLKYAIFKNWLGTRPKMETNEPNVYRILRILAMSGALFPFNGNTTDPKLKVVRRMAFMGL